MRLMTVMSIDSFLNLQHDEFVKKFDVAAVVIVAVITIFELIMGNGMFCIPPFATMLLATRVGTTVDMRVPFNASGSGFPWYTILASLAFVVYLVSVLIENKGYLVYMVWQIKCNLFKRKSKINHDPELGEELQTMSTEARVSQCIGLERSVTSPFNSNPEDSPRIIQVAAYQPSDSPEVLSVHKEVESQLEKLSSRNETMICTEFQDARSEQQEPKSVVSPSCQEDTRVMQESVSQSEKSFPRLETFSYSGDPATSAAGHSDSASVLPVPQEETPETENYSNGAQPHESGEQPGESSQENSWKASFMIAILAFIGCFIFILSDVKKGLAFGVIERLTILSCYCLPFYWVLLVEECYLVSKRIVRTWLADYCSIYFD